MEKGKVSVEKVSERSGTQRHPRETKGEETRAQERLYAHAVSSPSSEDSKAKSNRSVMGASSEGKKGSGSLAGSKRPRLPTEATCGRCFRASHKTADCRHQVVCLRYACVGHMAARCPMIPRRSLHKKQIHVRSKISEVQVKEIARAVERPSNNQNNIASQPFVVTQRSHKASISLSLSPEIE